MFPFPLGEVDYAPVRDRLAVFNSTEMLHRVMPATAPRACLSIWFARGTDAAPVKLPTRFPAELVEHGDAGVLNMFLNPLNRRLFAKLMYAEVRSLVLLGYFIRIALTPPPARTPSHHL